MEKLRCLVVEPDQNARNLIQHYIEKTPFLEWMAGFEHPLEALGFLQAHPADLIFMDFAMPELSGADLLQMLHPKPLVIFTTTQKEHAWHGFQLNAVDFLLKPLDFQLFLQGAGKALRLFYLLKTAYHTNQVHAENHYLILKSNRKYHRIHTDEILYIQGMKEYAAIHFKDQSRLLILHSLRNLEALLPNGNFIRIHKSYIVANNKITALEGNMLFLGELKVPVGEHYKQQVINLIFS